MAMAASTDLPMNSKRRVLVFGGLSLVLLAGAGTARAESPRVGIMRFVGPGETDFRVMVTKIVGGRGFSLVGARALEEAAESTGKELSSKEGIRAIGADLVLAAIIDGRIEREGGAATARIAIRDPKDGSIAANELFTVPRGGPRALARTIQKTFWRRLGPVIEEVTGHESETPKATRRSRNRRS
jgi:hypothetical protein